MNGADLAVLVVPFLDGSSNRVEAGTDLEAQLSVILFLGLSPIFFSDLLLVYIPKRNLCSSDNAILCIHILRTKTIEHRSFSFAAPTIWNSMPTELRHTVSIKKFMSAQRTHLFMKFYA